MCAGVTVGVEPQVVGRRHLAHQRVIAVVAFAAIKGIAAGQRERSVRLRSGGARAERGSRRNRLPIAAEFRLDFLQGGPVLGHRRLMNQSFEVLLLRRAFLQQRVDLAQAGLGLAILLEVRLRVFVDRQARVERDANGFLLRAVVIGRRGARRPARQSLGKEQRSIALVRLIAFQLLPVSSEVFDFPAEFLQPSAQRLAHAGTRLIQRGRHQGGLGDGRHRRLRIGQRLSAKAGVAQRQNADVLPAVRRRATV